MSDTTITHAQFLDALDGIGQAVGRALQLALSELDVTADQQKVIATRLTLTARTSGWAGPDASVFAGIPHGFIEGMAGIKPGG